MGPSQMGSADEQIDERRKERKACSFILILKYRVDL